MRVVCVASWLAACGSSFIAYLSAERAFVWMLPVFADLIKAGTPRRGYSVFADLLEKGGSEFRPSEEVDDRSVGGRLSCRESLIAGGSACVLLLASGSNPWKSGQRLRYCGTSCQIEAGRGRQE